MIYNHINWIVVYDITTKQKKLLKQIWIEKEYGSEYNGFGYANKNRVYTLTDEQYNQFLSLWQEQKKVKKEKTQEEKMQARAKRLDRLTSCWYDSAMEMAQEKLDYQRDRIQMMICRQNEFCSIKRAKLIAKMERENPLRYIKNEDHAQAILCASNRHNNSNYDSLLDEARENNSYLWINKNEIKEYARQHMQYA